MGTQKKARFFRAILSVILCVAATSAVVPACIINKLPGEAQTTCPCTGQKVMTIACSIYYEGAWCNYDMPGMYCGTGPHGDCYVGVAYDAGDECPNVVKQQQSSLVRDDVERSFVATRGPKLQTCGDPGTFRNWLRTAPGFPAHRNLQSGAP